MSEVPTGWRSADRLPKTVKAGIGKTTQNVHGESKKDQQEELLDSVGIRHPRLDKYPLTYLSGEWDKFGVRLPLQTNWSANEPDGAWRPSDESSNRLLKNSKNKYNVDVSSCEKMRFNLTGEKWHRCSLDYILCYEYGKMIRERMLDDIFYNPEPGRYAKKLFCLMQRQKNL